MEEFLEAMNNGKGLDFLSDYKKYQKLSYDDLRNISKELCYAIEDADLLKGEKEDIFEIATENLSE